MFAETAPQKVSVKKMLREAAAEQVQESAPLQQAVQYVSDVVVSFKIAIKDVVQGGAVFTKLFGSKVNPEYLAEQAQLLMRQGPATGLSTTEQQRITAKIEKYLIEAKQQAKDSAAERFEYDEFLYQLNQQITKISDVKEKSMLLAARDIYKAKYTKELKEAGDQARLLKSLPEFIAHMQHTCLDKSAAFAVIHPHILASLIKAHQLQEQTNVQLDASGIIKKEITSHPEEEHKDQNESTIRKTGEQEPIIPVFEDINDLLKQQHAEQKLDPRMS